MPCKGRKYMKITEHVYQVGGQGFSASEDAAIYLISGNGSAALIDAGCGNSTDRLMQNIDGCGVALWNIRLLFLTHCHRLQFDFMAVYSVICQSSFDESNVIEKSVPAAGWLSIRMLPLCASTML